ncbi:Ditrans,polycis-undecaprenyl-diphosphate synthase ((2E,6E)-farnesyl-diphosphate specific) [bioreactor metagenome]|uniref:Ditrans,polycis-undecaprenyl-diphosphate synthase ((2E,6E)-farnesyl-diphosphate specific) n=1 Tax=bioreactor metagenome TaxID=1076179 RepID=A0A645CEP6_9ZZZZ
MNKLRHVAIIMDGNGRWAQKQHQERTYGHYQGVENVRNIAIRANDLHIEVLTLYAFSTENWSRPLEEVNYLMKLPEVFFSRFLTELMEKNIRIAMIGFWDKIPADTQRVLKMAISKTAGNTGMTLYFAMNYGGKQEILEAVNQCLLDNKDQSLTKLDEAGFDRYLQSGAFPDVDLMIRTSGEYRISNFLLWKLAYAELAFLPEAWPEFTPARFAEVIEDFYHRNRRFGGLK